MDDITKYYAQHYFELVASIVRMTDLPKEIIEDIVSDAYLAEMVNPKKVTSLSPAARVMIRVRRELKKFLKNPLKFLPLINDFALEVDESPIQADFLPGTLKELKRYMPLNFRVIYMKYYCGMDDKAICERLGFDELAIVKNRAQRGLEFLAREIEVKVSRLERPYRIQEKRKLND